MGLNSTLPLDRGRSDSAPPAAAVSGAAPEGGLAGVELGRCRRKAGCARAEAGGKEAGARFVAVFFPSHD